MLLKDGEYQLYSFDGSEVKAIEMPDTEIRMKAYGPDHVMENYDRNKFYWFEYVPYKGLVRVHDGVIQKRQDYGYNQERYDYYLKYTNGSFIKELEVVNMYYTENRWSTYHAEQEIENEEFLN